MNKMPAGTKEAARLEKLRSQIKKIEALAKGKLDIDAIKDLKFKRPELNNKLQEVKSSADTKGARIKTEIEADSAKFKLALGQVAADLKSHTASKQVNLWVD
jgi:cobyrinic acid a,c-diamide synthase